MFHHLSKTFVLFAAITTVTLAATPAVADILYVSTTGKNSNPCTLGQPCRTLQNAIGKTPAGGEIHVLDSGFYGNNAMIKKSLTISGNGHTVMLSVPITIHKADAVVTVRRLALNGKGSVQHGILVSAAAAVHVEHCLVHGFAGDGIHLNSVGISVFVSDSVFRGNGGWGMMADGGGLGKLAIDNSRFQDNQAGLAAIKIDSTIKRSMFSGNVSSGVHIEGARGSVLSSTSASNANGYYLSNGAHVVFESSVGYANSGSGLYVVGGSATVSNSVFTHNGTGIFRDIPGVVLTRENNTVVLNTTNVVNSVSPLGGV